MPEVHNVTYGPVRLRCNYCGHTHTEAEYIERLHPLRAGEFIRFCPCCKDPADSGELCSFPGCSDYATCGTPSKKHGYQRTCHKHRPNE